MRDIITNHKKFLIIILFLMVLVIPLTILQVQTQQELRQRAESPEFTIGFFNQSNYRVEIGNVVNVSISIKNSNKKDISAVDFTLTYDKSKLALNDFQPEGTFEKIIDDYSQPGIFRYVGVNPNDNTTRTSSEVVGVGTLHLRGKNTGDSLIQFEPATQIAVSIQADPVFPSRETASVRIFTPETVPTVTQTPIPTATPIPVLFTCTNQTGLFAGNYQCAAIINGAVQCPSGFGDFSPSTPYTGTSCSANQGCCKQGVITQGNLFACQNQTGTYAGNYTCADIINGATQCPEGYSNFQESSPYTGTSCGSARGCCKQNPVTPTKTPTPTPTPIPGAPTATPTLTLTPTRVRLAADVDNNGCLNSKDFSTWLSAYREGTVRQGTQPDINQDGKVNLLDFNAWFNAMKTSPKEDLCK